MPNKIYRIASSAFLIIVLISSILLIGTARANAIGSFKLEESFAAVIPDKDNEHPSQSAEESEKLNTLTDEKKELKFSSDSETPYPDLGDDQVFPFVAGLDSYEGR